MYLLGHLALGYFSAKATKKIVNIEFNTTLVWIVSLLPDIDLMIPPLNHRGPTHSIIIAIIAFIPILIVFKKKGLPYLASLVSHSLIGDLFNGQGVQLFWPLNHQWIEVPCSLMLKGRFELLVEIILFLAMLGYLYLIEPRESDKGTGARV